MDVNLRDSLQRTPLFIAIKELKTSFVELLFEYRTDIDAVDAKEQCCIDYFDFENFDAVLWDLLQSKLQVKFSIDNVGELTGQEIVRHFSSFALILTDLFYNMTYILYCITHTLQLTIYMYIYTHHLFMNNSSYLVI